MFKNQELAIIDENRQSLRARDYDFFRQSLRQSRYVYHVPYVVGYGHFETHCLENEDILESFELK